LDIRVFPLVMDVEREIFFRNAVELVHFGVGSFFFVNVPGILHQVVQVWELPIPDRVVLEEGFIFAGEVEQVSYGITVAAVGRAIFSHVGFDGLLQELAGFVTHRGYLLTI
jgi:hypothetical protein